MSDEVEVYPRAPIAEAMLEIQMFPLPSSEVGRVAEFQSSISNEFPSKQERTVWKQHVTFRPGEAPKSDSPGEINGYFFKSTDGKRIVQVGSEAFSFHRLQPYENWQTFRDEAKQLWQKYTEHIKIVNITRAGLRYINRIEVPLPFKDFRDFCILFPDIPADLPQGLSEMFLRMVIPDTASPSIAAITLTFEPPRGPDATSIAIILDIDSFQMLPPIPPSDTELWTAFERLRTYKNRVFNSVTTDAAKELFR